MPEPNRSIGIGADNQRKHRTCLLGAHTHTLTHVFEYEGSAKQLTVLFKL